MNENSNSGLTIEQKRLALLRRQRNGGARPVPGNGGIPVVPGNTVVPASFAQQRLWFLDRLAPGNPFYTVSLEMPLEGAIRPDLLEQALVEIARRHAVLRTTFVEKDGQPIQHVKEQPDFPMERIDLSSRVHDAVRAALDAINREEADRSFDLTRGPLAVARLVKLGATRHRLFLTLHHIVCDGWSLKVLGNELTNIYTALAEGRPHGLPDLAVQYRDFAAWQRDKMGGGGMAAHQDYWTQQLAGAPELALPTDFQRPTVPTYGGAFVPFTLDHDCAEQIRAFCAKDGVTPFMVLLTVWMVQLGRQSDMDDILVAAPSAGRDRRELEAMIGFFVNTLVLRGDISGDPTFRQAVVRIRDTCLEAYAHEEFPFDRLIEELAPKRRGDRNPLAQVVFQLFSAPDRSLGHAAPEERQRGTSKFDLRLDLWETENGYSGELEYSTDLFEHTTAELMAEQFQVLLHDLMAEPEAPISQANIMSQREYEWLLENCNQTDRPWPEDADVASCFAEAVRRHGDRTALSWGDQALSYDALDRASDGAAAEFAAAGLAPGDHVAVLLPRSVDMITAWLGILKIGAAYVPLDTDTPVARILGALETVKAAALVSDPDHAAKFGDIDTAVLLADIARWRSGSSWTAVRRAPDDVANIMFTSGSTGTPKAVVVPQQGIVRLAMGQEFWSVQPGDTIAHGSNAAFDAATLEVWTALLNGCRLRIVNRDALLSSNRLGDLIATGVIDHLFLTTALLHRLADEAPAVFAPLKSLITGGSRLEPDVARSILRNGPPCRFVNAYGPTETTTLGTTWLIDGLDAPLTNVPIGKPICNSTAYVLDGLGRLVPRTVPGELFLGGPGVALGYLDEPQQTSRKFGPSPFRSGERLYATGDRVRLRHDGSIDFLGRFDDQKKIRGFRVEPDEIAAALQSHPSVAEAQALIQEVKDAAGRAENRILAFYVPKSKDNVQAARLETATEAVAYWQRIYDEVVYQDVGKRPEADAQFDITGWTNSATGELLPDADMAEQIRQTCDRILDLGGRDILEFGCGTGLIMFPLAPKVDTVQGIDISRRALAHVRKTAELAGLHNITLHHGSAEVLAEFADDSFDTVVLNSTVQYFPSEAYLLSLVADLLRITRPGGAIFLGDIRHLGLLESFQAEIALDQADLSMPASAIWNAVTRKVEEEQELLLDPNWFLALRDHFADVGDITIELKRGEGHNELARFRYDVVLHIGEATPAPMCEDITWGQDVASLEDLLNRAPREGGPDLLVRRIPNLRTAKARAAASALAEAPAAATVGDVKKIADASSLDALSPEQLCTAFTSAGISVQAGWSDDPAYFELYLSASERPRRLTLAGTPPGDRVNALVNSPAQGRSLRLLEAELGAYLERLLPDYMLPQGYVRVSAMPLNANGKVDKKALAASLITSASGPSRPPQTEIERKLAAIFCAVLQVQHVGLDDDFFRLGGHSLKATQVMSRIVTEFGVSVPLRAIFESGTVEGLVKAVESATKDMDRNGRDAAIAPVSDRIDIDEMDGEALDQALAMLEDVSATGPS